MNPLFRPGEPTIIAALHLPPLPGSANPGVRPMVEIVDYALRNSERAVRAGVKALYIQDLGDTPHAPSAQPYTVAGMSVVGAALRREFPELALGVCLLSHGAKEPLAIAQAIDGQFVRLKVFVGAMVKAEGLLQGCAFEAIQYRHQANAEHIAILADVYDRTGEPLGRMPLADEIRQAAVFGRADGLVLTGKSVNESLEMLAEARQAKPGVPLLLGGSASVENLDRFLPLADGIIVSSAFKAVGGWTRQGLNEDWDENRIQVFMNSVAAHE